jgi:hypothetical protein
MLTAGCVRVELHDAAARFVAANQICDFDARLFAGRGLPPLAGGSWPRGRCAPTRRTSATRSAGPGRERGRPARPPIVIVPEGASTSGDYMPRFPLGAFISDLPVQLAAIRYRLWGNTAASPASPSSTTTRTAGS